MEVYMKKKILVRFVQADSSLPSADVRRVSVQIKSYSIKKTHDVIEKRLSNQTLR